MRCVIGLWLATLLSISAIAQNPKLKYDYVLPADLPPGNGSPGTILRTLSTNSAFDDSQTVQYRAFSGLTYTLVKYSGKYCAILFTPAWDKVFTREEKRRYLDQLDMFYEHFKEIVGAEPAGEGLLNVAHVPLRQGAGGLGLVGVKGIELLDEQFHIDAIKAEAMFNGLNDGAIHEMAHNFDLYSSQLQYTADHAHAWVVGIETFVGAYADIRLRRFRNSKNWEHVWYHQLMDPYLNTPNRSWERCVVAGTCPNVLGNQTWGGFQRLIALLYGPESIKKAMRFIRDRRTQNPPPTPQGKADLHVEALAHGANADLSCVVDAVTMYASPGLRAAMASKYGPNSICMDRDGDGYNPVTGDWNEADPKINPGVKEVANGIDDDCDGFIDNLFIEEAAGADFAGEPTIALGTGAKGQITTGNDDAFRIQLESTTLVEFKLTSRGSFAGWIFLYEPNNVSFRTYCYVAAGSNCSIQQTLPPGNWRFIVALNNASAPGPYMLETAERVLGPVGVKTAPPLTQTGGAFRLTAEFSGAAFKRPPTEVRYWVSEFGFVGSRPYASSTSFDWTPPGALRPGVYGYRVQAFANDNPVSEPTFPQFFGAGVGAPATMPPFTGAISLKHTIGSPPIAAQRVPIHTAGLPLSYTLASAPDWLTVTPTTGTTRGELLVALNQSAAERLAIGAHIGAITLSVPNSAQLTLSIPATLTLARPPIPTITGVYDSWSYRPGAASGTWVTILGKNLAARQSTWTLTGSLLPTVLDGTVVRVNGVSAPILYASPEQVNVLIPGLWGAGPMGITVQTVAGTSASFSLTAKVAHPAIYTVSGAGPADQFITAALAGTGTLIGNRIVDARVSRAAKPGDLLDLYVIGAGPTFVPSEFITDRLFSGAFPINAGTRALLGSSQLIVHFAGLTSPGLYLVRVQIPDDALPGAHRLVLTFDNESTAPAILVVE